MNPRLFLRILALASLLVGIAPGFAQDASMSLEECIRYALQNNQNLQNTRFDAYLADRQAKEILAQAYPQVNGTIDLNYFAKLPVNILPPFFPETRTVFIKTEPVQGRESEIVPYQTTLLDDQGNPVFGEGQEIIFGTPWQSTLAANLRQLVFDATVFLGFEAARVYEELSLRQIEVSVEDLVANVSQAYYNALLAQERLEVLDANIARTAELFENTSGLFEEGFVEKIDVQRLEITRTNLELERTNARRLVQYSVDLLKFQMGMPVSEEITLDGSVDELEPEAPTMLSLGGFDFSDRPAYRLVQKQQELETYNTRRIRAGYYPTVYAFGNAQINAQRNSFNLFDFDQPWFPTVVVGATVNIPIFDGLRKHQQIQQSQINLSKLAQQEELLRNSIQLELRNTHTQLLNAYSNLDAYTRNRDLAEEVFRVAEIKYREGVGSSLEVNEADTQLKQAQSNYLQGLFGYLTARVAYERARGTYRQYYQEAGVDQVRADIY